jgi:hypothetical protein
VEVPVFHSARVLAFLTLGGLALVLLACGGNPVTGPGLGDETRVITEGSQSGIPPFQTSGGAAYFVVVRTNVTGTLEASVDWTVATNQLAIFWGRGDCTQNPNCDLLSQNAGTSKPKTVSTINASPGLYSLGVLNMGTSNESISYRVTLRR